MIIKMTAVAAAPSNTIQIKSNREEGDGRGGQGTGTCLSVQERSRQISMVAVEPKGVYHLNEREVTEARHGLQQAALQR